MVPTAGGIVTRSIQRSTAPAPTLPPPLAFAVFCPHPRAKGCTIAAARIVRDAAIEAGAPADIVSWIEEPSMSVSQYLMRAPEISLIVATGGPAMVRAAYSSGHPSIGVGALPEPPGLPAPLPARPPKGSGRSGGPCGAPQRQAGEPCGQREGACLHADSSPPSTTRPAEQALAPLRN